MRRATNRQDLRNNLEGRLRQRGWSVDDFVEALQKEIDTLTAREPERHLGLRGKCVERRTVERWLSVSHPQKPQKKWQGPIASTLGVRFGDLLRPYDGPAMRLPHFTELGLYVLSHLPVALRSSMHNQISRALDLQDFEVVNVEAQTDVERVWRDFARKTDQKPSFGGLKSWAKGRRAALVLDGFRGSKAFVERNDPESSAACKAAWDDYTSFFIDARRICLVVLIQAVNPLHSEMVFTTNSVRADYTPITPPSAVLMDSDLHAAEVFWELPPCCIDLLLTQQPSPRMRSCQESLEEVGIYRRTDSGAPGMIVVLEEGLKELRKGRTA